MSISECLSCGSELIENGYEGDWKQLSCSGDNCDITVERPVSDASQEGFTMESLNNLTDYTDE